MNTYSMEKESQNLSGKTIEKVNHPRYRRPVISKLFHLCIAAMVSGTLASTPAYALKTKIQTGPTNGGLGGGTIELPPDDGRPPRPAVFLKTLSDSSIELSWMDTSDRELGYRVYRQIENGNETLIDTLEPVDGAWGIYPDINLAPDTKYVYRVAAFNDVGTIYSSGVRAYTDRRPQAGQSLGQAHLLTHNVLGLPTEHDYLTGWTDCQLRGPAIGDWLANINPAYTVASLQELYPDRPFGDHLTCDPYHLLNSARATGRYAARNNVTLFHPRAATATGGTGTLGLVPFNTWSGEPWAGNYNGLLGQGSKQGFVFSRIPVPNSNIVLDVYNVHIYSRGTDHCDQRCQRGELEQLSHRIHQLSANSGNPVIIMGDFNIGGPPATPTEGDGWGASYNDIKDALLDPQDLWFSNHPDENGVTTNPSVDNLIGKRIDYIFVATDPYLTNNPYSIFIRNRDDVSVVRWGTGFGPVSDHKGVHASVEIRSSFTAPSFTPPASAETEQALTVLAAMDSVIAPVYESFIESDGDISIFDPIKESGSDVNHELDAILEQQFADDRAAATNALITARRVDAQGSPVSEPTTTTPPITTNPTTNGTTTSNPATMGTMTSQGGQIPLQNQPFTPHSIRNW